ncbi:Zinc finger protein ADR1 [Pleurostoma richardsiae]|uniref:Zinc finger protein ADR1 n=1 Tax=Pleurostoma richardsiae TaxID=41990 RepID=A0AA38VH22_9PEZI|nr:Zinc finger protein ADR1 [Pleurostoma richardsiae]
MAVLNDAGTSQESPATNSPSSTPMAGNANTDAPTQSDDTASTITVNTKTPASFPPPKTDKPRPHVCATCQRSFARLEHLKRHERSHTKEKPFECPECARCFARRDLLLRHQQKLHQTTTPSSRPRNRRESTSGAVPGQSRARKGSVAGGAASAAASMRPRANTISHVDGAAMHLMAANTSVARPVPQTHSRHASLVGLPIHNMDHTFTGMSNSLGQRGVNHGLPKLETHSINMDFSGGLRTAPPMAVFNPDFDFEGMLFGPGNTINPNALHYSDSPQTMAVDNTSPFSHGLQDMSAGQQVDDNFDWLTGFEHQMSFSGTNDNAVDGSSPSAISTTSQSGISDVMLDGSNHPASAAPGTSAMWQPAIMGPPQITTNLFSLDMNGSVFPDLMNGAPVSPQPPAQKSLGDAYFSTPPPSLSSLSPSMMPGLNPQNMNHALNFGAGPETPTSMNGITHGTSPVSTITDSTRNAILGALASAASMSSALGGRKQSFTMPASPMSPLGQATAIGVLDPASRNLPSTQDLQRYVGAYLRYFHPHMPFFHIPTLSFEIPAKSASLASMVGGSACLVLSMATIGALYELELDRSRELFEMAKKMIQTYLEQRRKANVRKAGFRGPPASEQGTQSEGSVDTPVWLVQAMLLNVVYGHNCGEKRAGEIASTHCAALVSLAQGADLFRPARAAKSDDQDAGMTDSGSARHGPSDSMLEEQAEWLEWKVMEERKRTLYAIFILSSLLVSAYNHTPALTNSEIFLNLPCDEEFFAAESSAAFHAMGGAAAASRNCMTFHEALGELLRTSEKQRKLALGHSPQAFGAPVSINEASESDLKPSSFGCLILINALHNYIWETRQRHHTKVWTNEETEKMHAHIEPALKAWQAAWASNPKHSLERPNPFGLGPLSADAIPLLDLAYVRLFVNLSRSKERFWQRDWDGMADELSRGSEIIQHAEHSPASNESTTTDASEAPASGSLFVDSPLTQSSPPGFPSSKFLPQTSTRASSRREKHLRKAAFYAADSLSMADKLGVTFADFTSRELPLQSAMCAFDCAQVLAEWVATLQDRVGRYVGILGQDEVDLSQVPAIMLLEDEDAKLLAKVQEVLSGAEVKMNMELVASTPGIDTRLQIGEITGYAAKILRVTAYMLNKAAVWPVTRLMAQCLEAHANHLKARAEKSILPSG